MPDRGILAETIEAIESAAPNEIDALAIERAVVGLFFTGVKLSTGHVGACATPIKAIPEAVCCPSSLHAWPFPGKMRGRRAAAFLDEVRQQDGIRRAVGIATMNAMAAFCRDRRPHPAVDLETGIDAFDAADIRPGQLVVVVGAFVTFLRELKKRGQPYLVLEQDPATLKPDEMPFYRHASQAAAVVPQADVILITGTTLLNDTLDGLLSAANPAACKVVVGPTVGLVPDAYLRRGCHILGTIKVTRPDEFLDVLAEGGSGYHFFGRCAEKIVLRARRPGEPAQAGGATVVATV
jgi:uncharacterized protein (DUF4213/DUF364 family)